MPFNEIEALKFLSQNPWKAFFIHGEILMSEISSEHINDKCIYSFGGIVVDCGRKIYIGAATVDVTPGEDIFRIGVWEDIRFGEPEYEKLFRPSRRLLTQFPDNLKLDSFLGTNLTIKRVKDSCMIDNTIFTCDKGLIVRNLNSQILLVVVDESIPLNIKVTMSAQECI